MTGGSPTICLANANISVSNGNAIDITGGSPAIIVQGSSSVTSNSGAGIYVAQNSTVTIKGSSQKDKLTATGGGNGSAGIGGYINNNMFVACGNIKIDNITLSAQGNRDLVGSYPPGIGGIGNATCGTISIRNAIVHAYASYISLQSAPAIGMGSYAYETGSSILTIQIENSTIYAHRGAYADYIGQFGNINDDKGGRVLFGTGGYCKSSTVYCYTSDTLDKTMVYDENGTEL